MQKMTRFTILSLYSLLLLPCATWGSYDIPCPSNTACKQITIEVKTKDDAEAVLIFSKPKIEEIARQFATSISPDLPPEATKDWTIGTVSYRGSYIDISNVAFSNAGNFIVGDVDGILRKDFYQKTGLCSRICG